MKQLIKSFFINTLAIGHGFPTGMTDPSDLRSLIKNLHPIATNKDLIRLGPNGDGGYLVPNDLEGLHACFSPGVSHVSGFEKDCAELEMKVFLADKSVVRPADNHELFSFTQKYIGAMTNNDFMTLDSWVNSSLSDTTSELLLQIDIEGYEYETFLSTSDSLMGRFRIIVAEFHNLCQLWNRPFFNLARSTFNKILQTHSCVHIHPNNCCGSLIKDGLDIPKTMEFTFLRNDRFESFSHQTIFPNPLDYDNTNNPTLALPRCWYSEK